MGANGNMSASRIWKGAIFEELLFLWGKVVFLFSITDKDV